MCNAQNKASKILLEIKATDSDSLKVELYTKLHDYYSFAKPDSAYYFIESALQEFDKNGSRYGIASMYTLLGSLDNKHGRALSAKKRLEEALTMFTEINSARGVAKVNNLLGIIEAKQGNYDRAMSYFLKALTLFKSLNSDLGSANSYMNMSNVSEGLGNPDKAMEYCKSGILLMEGTDNVSTLCNLYNNAGILYGKKGDLKSAGNYFRMALDKSNEDQYIDIYLYSMLNLGILSEISGEITEALRFFNDALQISIEKDLPEEQARLLVNIAGVTSVSKPEEAIEQLNRALLIGKKLGNKMLLTDIYRLLIDNFKELKNYTEVVHIYEEQNAIIDSLYDIEKIKEIANLESVYELEQTNNSFKALQLKQRSEELKRNILILVTVSLILIIVIITVFFRKTRLLNKELSMQKANLTTANDTKDKLFSIIGHDLRGPVSNIPVVLQMLSDKDTSEEEKQFLMDSLTGQAVTVVATLDRLLFWGKSHLKNAGMTKASFNGAPYISDNIELLTIQAKQKRLEISDQTVATSIFGVAAHFDFIIRNLLSNAIKFTPEQGTITISSDETKRPGYVVYGVRDTGAGIDPDQRSSIFEPMFASTNGTSGEKGSGIGLMLCKEFVTENGGEIWFETKTGVGTTFYFSFKAA